MKLTIRECPFCDHTPEGDENTFVTPENSKWGCVQCPSCGACGPDVRTGYKPWNHWHEFATVEWNKRSIVAEGDAAEAIREYVRDFEMEFMVDGVIVDNPDNVAEIHYKYFKKILGA